MNELRYFRDMDVSYGTARALSQRVRHVLAQNPSPFTFHGTGTYIVGQGHVAVIDPGPDDAGHVAALLAALDGETVDAIMITHTHHDHSPAAAALKRATGAPTYGFGPHPLSDGRPTDEAGDMAFQPDHRLSDGDVVTGPDWTLAAVHTPGHISNHLCFALREEEALFSGDHVMGWSTSVVSPPDGNMRDYMASLRRLLGRGEQRYYPTHGPAIPDPERHVRGLIDHRLNREAQILTRIAAGDDTIPAMVAVMYRDVPQYLHPAAGRSVLAHIVQMREDGRLAQDGAVAETARYRLINGTASR